MTTSFSSVQKHKEDDGETNGNDRCRLCDCPAKFFVIFLVEELPLLVPRSTSSCLVAARNRELERRVGREVGERAPYTLKN